MAILYPGIQSIVGFPRKFKIADDIPKVNWATVEDVEILGETVTQQIAEVQQEIAAVTISHNQLLNIGDSDHHDKLHGSNHNGASSDPLPVPFDFKTSAGVLVARLDVDGNFYLKGRQLKL